VILYFADVPAQARAWVGPIPVTNVARTLADCVASDVSGETIRAAIREFNRRGLLRQHQGGFTVRGLERTHGTVV
jgi:predicted transcriptional regulator of viral defense system